MADVVELETVTRLDIPPERIINNAPRDLDSVVMLGWTADGEFYFASSVADGANVLWLLELAKLKLMTEADY